MKNLNLRKAHIDVARCFLYRCFPKAQIYYDVFDNGVLNSCFSSVAPELMIIIIKFSDSNNSITHIGTVESGAPPIVQRTDPEDTREVIIYRDGNLTWIQEIMPL